MRALPRGGLIIDLSHDIYDFADTAAVISCLDLVIMTDSSVAHLAGGMGKPVWLLLGYVAHWLVAVWIAPTVPGILRSGCFGRVAKATGTMCLMQRQWLS